MDISDVSDESGHENTTTSQVLRLSNPITSEILDNERLDNNKYDDNNSVLCDRNTSITKNATNSHPLMYPPISAISSDFPDLIPEKPKMKHYEKPTFLPQAHSTILENNTESPESFENHFNIDLSLDQYNEKLPGWC